MPEGVGHGGPRRGLRPEHGDGREAVDHRGEIVARVEHHVTPWLWTSNGSAPASFRSHQSTVAWSAARYWLQETAWPSRVYVGFGLAVRLGDQGQRLAPDRVQLF